MSAEGVAVERAADLDELQADWTALGEDAGHPFATWEWCSAWWRHLGEGLDLHAHVCRDAAGRALAFLPLYTSRTGPFRVARFFGEGDLRGPACAPGDREAAVAGMREAIGPGSGCSLLVAERLPGRQGWDELLGGRPLATHPDPVVNLKGVSWDDLLAARSRNFRQQVRRRERKLVEDHGLSFRLSEGAERIEADFETLIRLHELRWGGETSGVFDGPRGDFQREFAAAAGRRGWVRLWVAEIEEEPVAAWYGWRFAGQEWYYQAGRDPRFDDNSLGFVLLAHTIRAAAEDGVDSYRFLDGAEDYKWRFADEDLEAESRVVSRGPIGGLGGLAATAAARAPRGARRRLTKGPAESTESKR